MHKDDPTDLTGYIGDRQEILTRDHLLAKAHQAFMVEPLGYERATTVRGASEPASWSGFATPGATAPPLHDIRLLRRCSTRRHSRAPMTNPSAKVSIRMLHARVSSSWRDAAESMVRSGREAREKSARRPAPQSHESGSGDGGADGSGDGGGSNDGKDGIGGGGRIGSGDGDGDGDGAGEGEGAGEGAAAGGGGRVDGDSTWHSQSGSPLGHEGRH